MKKNLCYCIEDDCPLPHGILNPGPQEFPPGHCVDCGMNVPFGDIICDICKDQWQQYQNTGVAPHEMAHASGDQPTQTQGTLPGLWPNKDKDLGV